jgi:hypothetical protein
MQPLGGGRERPLVEGRQEVLELLQGQVRNLKGKPIDAAGNKG